MKELDGWRARARPLQFTFDQRLAKAHGADLICSGSYRLSTIYRLARQQGLITKAHLPHNFFYEPSVRQKVLAAFGTKKRAYIIKSSQFFREYLGLQLLACRLGLHKKESVHFLLVNLASGHVLFTVPVSLHLFTAGAPSAPMVRKRKITLKKAFQKATQGLAASLKGTDDGWAVETLRKRAQEEARLQEYFKDTNDHISHKQKRREISLRFTPRLEIDALRAAFLYIPLFQYRLVVVDHTGTEKIKSICYDPVSNTGELG